MANRYPSSRRARRRSRVRWPRMICAVLIVAAVTAGVIFGVRSCTKEGGSTPAPSTTPRAATPTSSPKATPVPQAAAVAQTQPDVLGLRAELNVDGQDVSTYERAQPIALSNGGNYTDLEGITAFRGNNYRDSASYGTPDVRERKLTEIWNVSTGSIQKGTGDGSWTGTGWTGQPIIVRWPAQTRAIMNINEEKKAKEDLVEVIQAAEDGHVYFIDLEDGERTRDTWDIGVSFKGAGCIDPRGYPLLYLGAGDWAPAQNGKERMDAGAYIYSLIDGERLYTYGEQDPYSQREFTGWDGNATVDADTDTVIQAGENGIFYTFKLNANYNPAGGAVSIDPSEIVKMRYTTTRIREQNPDKYWRGMEGSPVIWESYCYVPDNAGNLLCIDLNTMQVVWMQDVLDDTNGSPVLEIENGKPYLYISTSLHWTADEDSSGNIPIWKIDALTGEILWKTIYKCRTVSGVSGGVQSTALVGKNSLSELVYFTVARTPNNNDGILVALDKETGEEVWKSDMENYTWSSPVAVYAQDGQGYVIACDSGGFVHLYDGLTGEIYDSLQVHESVIEASPAVFDDILVIGTRNGGIYGVRIS